jgi:dienelactone hydrolase
MIRRFVVAALFILPTLALADGPADNNVATVRRVPKLGIEVPPERRAKLEAGLKELEGKILVDSRGPMSVYLPDVKIYHKAVHDALVYQEFFAPNEIDFAEKALAIGIERANQLADGKAPWTTATGLVVRGYVSKIDGSVQPYGLIVPASYQSDGMARHRCDLWFHGRGETLSELNFIRDRTNNVGQISPENTIVLHPYGRYCNANKFAGEMDAIEALDSVKSRYRVDEDRIAVRGFSMGGASAWHFAVHDPSRWFAANPGAGFSETPQFLNVFQQETLAPTWWEQKLWHLYDCPEWCRNLQHCPTIAYSGEIDRQKQAADVMEKALKAQQMDLVHIIGPKTTHAIHPESKKEIERRLAELAVAGRQQPKDVDFTTYTLRYNELAWVRIDGMGEHWQPAKVKVERSGPAALTIAPENVTGLTLSFAAGKCPFEAGRPVEITIQGQKLTVPAAKADAPWSYSMRLHGTTWKEGARPDDVLQKKHGLQGPIDDALMDSFIFVRPTGKAASEAAGKWSAAELDRAIEHWRRHFRGQARVKDDTAITADDIAGANLVLWGDPSSNAVLKKIAAKLPIQWTEKQIDVGGKTYDGAKHALIAVYPNPLNPQRYVVLNSSFTFRDYAYLNNARQVPMLPDWAVVDLTTPPGAVWPGKIADANFFDEQWQLKKK